MRRIALIAGLAACTGSEWTPPEGTRVSMDFAGDGLYSTPLPADHRRYDDGTVALPDYPNPDELDLVAGVLALVDGELDGFGTTAGVFFATDAPVDPASLPDLHGSVAADASMYLIGVDEASPDFGARYPITARFEAWAGPYGGQNLLSVVPLQGIALRPGTRYAVVVTDGVRDDEGNPLARTPQAAALLRGARPEGLSGAGHARWQAGVEGLYAAGVDAGAIVAFTVFTTGHPTARMDALAAHARSLATPEPDADWVHTETFDGYCVFESVVAMPVYQIGEPPYLSEGGGIPRELAVDHYEDARILVTIPRATQPEGGWPTTVMIRTGGGGDRPLVERGPWDADGNLIEPGSGPAMKLAEVGIAGVAVDGPHGGIRNVSGSDEQFLIFNIGNPAALMGNLQQSAVEIALIPDILAGVDLDASSCDGTSATATFRTDGLALMGHSMGATIAPLTLGVEPRYEAVVLSGAGGSWIENVVHKQSPLPVKPLAEGMLRYPSYSIELTEHDPFLSILQWGGESADPPPYAEAILAPGRHVLMHQGIVDTYILPPIANTTSLSLGLDLAGDAHDVGHPELGQFRPLEEVLPYSGRSAIALPASGNADGDTRVVVQHLEDGEQDGHEVMYELERPREQYACFLRDWAAGAVPEVPDEDCP